jgi:hypothetical protein
MLIFFSVREFSKAITSIVTDKNIDMMCEYFILLPNVELVHPLPASAEDELGVNIQNTQDAANTAAGSGLHEATCWSSCLIL